MRFLSLGLGVCLSWLAVPPRAMAQIAATQAFENSPVCSASDLSNNSDEARGNPEWKRVNGLTVDPNETPSQPMRVLNNNDQLTILEGFVAVPPLPPVCLNVLGLFTPCESSNDEAKSEVSEEDITWNHYTHDFTFKVVPDPGYQNLLSSWVRFPRTVVPNFPDPFCSILGGSLIGTDCVFPDEKCPDDNLDSLGTNCHHTEMLVEWENASLMDQGHFQRTWGAAPEFVWPAVKDRVWVAGRWIFDCGHPGVPAAAAVSTYVKYSTEIHPPRALVTFRLNHPALDSLPFPRYSAPNFPFPQSYLPVTGAPTTPFDSGPTNVPVTEADIYVSGDGGGANDLCMILALNGGNCVFGHTYPVIPVNDVNYVFDIYPPGTNYHSLVTGGSFRVTPPVPDASLQWRTVDHSTELPTHACGASGCVTVDPIFCLLDSSTPAPDQTETGCPAVPAHPTRLRVILPFCGTNLQSCVGNANFFAQSILLGWDDVPRPPTGVLIASADTSANVFAPSTLLGPVGLPGPVSTPAVRTFKVTLHKFTVETNSHLNTGDWRVFVNVGGQYRYMDSLTDVVTTGDPHCIKAILTNNFHLDCFLFDQTPWIVSVQDGTPIHVAVGGFEAEGVDPHFCEVFPAGADGSCHPFNVGDVVSLATEDDVRIGTYEFDLQAPTYQWILPDGSSGSSFTTESTKDNEQYNVEFLVEEIPAATAPASAPLGIGTPNFSQFVSSATPLTLSTASTDAEGFQYRSYLQGGPLPTYASTLPFPVHWTSAALPATSQSVPVFLTGVDGPYFLQYSAQSFGQLLEPRHTATLTLDNTPPLITISQPTAMPYTHSATLTLSYSADDGTTGSGVASFTPTMDSATTLPGPIGLQSGQPINLLTELKLGTHTFKVIATDNVGNASSTSVTFTIIVTAQSIKDDVTQFLAAGKITQDEGTSLLSKLTSAAKARAAGNCPNAATIYLSFISEVKAQSGKKIDPVAAAIMIADAQYLIANCP